MISLCQTPFIIVHNSAQVVLPFGTSNIYSYQVVSCILHVEILLCFWYFVLAQHITILQMATTDNYLYECIS